MPPLFGNRIGALLVSAISAMGLSLPDRLVKVSIGVRGASLRLAFPLRSRWHPPGHAQVEFGEAVGVIGGVRQKLHFFCMDLPHSDACFVKAYPCETTEAFLDGHVASFAFFGGVPLSIL